MRDHRSITQRIALEQQLRSEGMIYNDIGAIVGVTGQTVRMDLNPEAAARDRAGSRVYYEAHKDMIAASSADAVVEAESVDLQCLPTLIAEIDDMDHFPTKDERNGLIARYRGIEANWPRTASWEARRRTRRQRITAVLSVTDYLIRALCISQKYRIPEPTWNSGI